MNVPNSVTIARIVLAPIILFLVVAGRIPYAVILLALAFLTDVLDGYLARRLKQETELGRVLDVVSDKALALAAVLSMLWMHGISKWAYLLMFLSRDIFNLLFLVFSKKFRKSKKHSRPLGKATTFLQAIAAFWILLEVPSYEYIIYILFVVGIAASFDYFFAFTKKNA